MKPRDLNPARAAHDAIHVHGARHNNLKNLDLAIPLGELVVVTGVSGSGKSSLVFDTLYAEGQRRYVETFSPYARQFLDRMDKPAVDHIDGIPPAIAIDQTNPVRTSRSTVGTMTELNDHLKLLFARAAQLYCRGCGAPVRRDTPDSIERAIATRARDAGDPRLVVTFPVQVPESFSEDEVRELLGQQGYTRIHARRGNTLEVVQDRFRHGSAERARVIEAFEAALRTGGGRLDVHVDGGAGHGTPDTVWRFSADLHCADCDIHYQDPTPSLFSFNSPVGACETCRGFGRVIGIDFGLVIPDPSRTLGGGAIKPWQTKSYSECQDDMTRHARSAGVPMDVPFAQLSEAQQHWVLEGDDDWVSWSASWPGRWYGVRRFFDWLESKAYKMHVRVLLSRYRAYTPCHACDGARLEPGALMWRLGTRADANAVLDPARRFRARGLECSDQALRALPGLTIHDLMLLPVDRTRAFFAGVHLPAPLDEATDLLLTETRARLGYLDQVGLGYLTLDRQSRTLSGGEVQRINLTTALGTSLVNTLFALDEPSIGLHPRDMGRVIDVMKRLRDAGNSLVVVEHDPQIMLEADRLLDIGPGPGERGGEVVFFGPPQALLHHPGSLTADYLAGRRRVDEGAAARDAVPSADRLALLGASANNLCGIDVEFPLQRLVCVTGVSGSGKSTLVQDVLYPALLRHKGKPTETPGEHRALIGHESVAEVVMVDQTPIGRTTRSNPASYVGAFDAIRQLFAREDAARERGYTAGTFSFNSGNGRCPTCAGNGFEHVEMQFLSDVYLRCPDCNGRRYRAEVLDVTASGAGTSAPASIADVLDMTVTEAAAFFADQPAILATLRPLADVGLDYLALGQPVPTLSGGEAQRLKLAGHLVERAGARGSTARRGSLFLFDEPTTGLHFADIAKLLEAFRKLLDAGHSLVVIEHNLDVIRAADWVIDLGPEGGDAGGHVVATGTPAGIAAHETSHTGAALRDYAAALQRLARDGARYAAGRHVDGPALPAPARENAIHIHNAREHNLRNVDVRIPRQQFTVITGVSGSGKSTLAFDILFAEGQRRYLESLNAYARQFVQPASRPDVDAIFGIPPTVAIEQRTSRGGRKSTVATMTEIHHFLRLLFVKLGVQHCPGCQVPIEPQSVDAIAARILREYRGQHVGVLAPLVAHRKGYYTDLAKWAAGKGFGHLRVDGAFLPTSPWPRLSRFQEHTIELPVADLVISPAAERPLREALGQALAYGKGVVHVVGPLDGLMDGKATLAQRVFSTRRACPSCGTSFPELDPRLFSYNSRHGWCEACYGTGLKIDQVGWDEARSRTGTEDHVLDSWIDWLQVEENCPACEGRRLNPTALNVRFQGQSIAQLTARPVDSLERFVLGLALDGRAEEIARDIVAELRSRLRFLGEVGLSYLALDRAAPTLSGGEAQRIRLAAQLGSNLQGVCYILDEPTIGLHPRDNRILLDTLEKLGAKGNTLVVVEHDEDTIRRAHRVLDLGPGAGKNGGRVVAQGSADELMRNPDSVTGRFLAQPLRHPLVPRRPVDTAHASLQIVAASLHNLKDLHARIPLGRLTVITGVSGSGKSTLAREVLHDNLVRIVANRRRRQDVVVSGCRQIEGWEAIDRVLEVDQTPIGKTPRSCPATYVGFWDTIRKLFAESTEARMRGYGPARFSFNTGDGRCQSCEGQGVKTVEMSFLPDVKVACETCGGQRFNPETLAVRFKGRNIGEVLNMSVDEAAGFFAAHRSISHCLLLLQDVGLGYLTLGQQSPTLSGGEAQRIKLVTELAKVRTDAPAADARRRASHPSARGSTLYVLDEPTVGLHMADVEKLIRVLHRLVDAGNTVVVIEHNLDVMAEADWLLDLGPEGGDAGGRLVAEGAPEQVVARTGTSHTARVLEPFLRERAA
ncbi:MAG: excinuclease ABC subunit UvrA [Burkholderiales bacterium]|nr:excinuclease ABC subunit UvrA [Burkholderiales bacterium]